MSDPLPGPGGFAYEASSDESPSRKTGRGSSWRVASPILRYAKLVVLAPARPLLAY